MGGELDSTNVIDTPEMAVITAIGLDHTAELGDTLGKIASAKGGIIKACGDVVIYPQAEEAEIVLKQMAEGEVLPRLSAGLFRNHSRIGNAERSDF